VEVVLLKVATTVSGPTAADTRYTCKHCDWIFKNDLSNPQISNSLRSLARVKADKIIRFLLSLTEFLHDLNSEVGVYSVIRMTRITEFGNSDEFGWVWMIRIWR
jgi:hypothetical protein